MYVYSSGKDQASLRTMFSISFLAFSFIYQLSTTSGDSLDYYDAKKRLDIVELWYHKVKDPLIDAITQLNAEATNQTGKNGSRMDYYLQRAKSDYHRKWNDSIKCVSDLTQEECLAVMMYTDEFYKEYNLASSRSIWTPYKVYTTLLTSGLKKLAQFDPIHDATLYLGIRFKAESPICRRIFWKAFTSTSLNVTIARGFAGLNGTVLEFRPPASSVAGKVGMLTNFPQQKEVILLPFEEFDVVQDVDQGFYFKSTKIQKVLKPTIRVGKL